MRVLVAIVFMIALSNVAIAADPIWLKFSGEKAFAQVKALVDLGPRPAGSAALEKSRVLIEKELQATGWKVTRQTFTAQTPRGAMTFSNIIATFGDKPQFLLCSHYDTKTFDTISFVGANDGGSSTGLLLEMARVLALQPSLAAKVELVFFDGEEAFENFTASDGLFGSRHFAESLGENA
ncbi:MAG: M28 family peptidase, partial [Verrucomicrobiota bacterium]|nr:M28 family peptidase [Verrucomicrobiota bacterium]